MPTRRINLGQIVFAVPWQVLAWSIDSLHSTYWAKACKPLTNKPFKVALLSSKRSRNGNTSHHHPITPNLFTQAQPMQALQTAEEGFPKNCAHADSGWSVFESVTIPQGCLDEIDRQWPHTRGDYQSSLYGYRSSQNSTFVPLCDDLNSWAWCLDSIRSWRYHKYCGGYTRLPKKTWKRCHQCVECHRTCTQVTR